MTYWISRAPKACAAAILALALSAGPALAVFPGGGGGGSTPGGGGGSTGGGGGGGGGGGNQVPEIGLGAAASALTILVGATLIALDRRHRREVKVEPQQG